MEEYIVFFGNVGKKKDNKTREKKDKPPTTNFSKGGTFTKYFLKGGPFEKYYMGGFFLRTLHG